VKEGENPIIILFVSFSSPSRKGLGQVIAQIARPLAGAVARDAAGEIGEARLEVFDVLLVGFGHFGDLVFQHVAGFVLAHGLERGGFHLALQLGWDAEEVDGERDEADDDGEAGEEGGE